MTATLTLDFEIAAPPPVVWLAFANEQSFGEWYTPDPDWVPDLRAFGFEVGAKQVVAFGPEGEPPYVETNEILELVENEKIKLKVGMSQGDQVFNTTEATLTFTPSGKGGTTLSLVETGVDPDEVDDRRGGWTGTFENLCRLLADDGLAQTWSGSFAAPLARVWQAFLSADDVGKWFTPFEGAQIKVHECGSELGARRRITFGIGEPWEHTITETILAMTPEKEITLAVDMEMEGHSYSTIKGTLTFSENGGATQIDLAVTDGPTPERAMRCAGWGATLNNLNLVL